MRRLLLLGAVTASLLVPAPTPAQVTLGARVGYGFGLGKVGGTLTMGDWVKGQIPIQVDALYRLNPRLALGGYFSWGFGRVGGDLRELCELPGADCSASVMRVGVQGILSLAPRGKLVPWVGAGLGYEWNRLDSSDPTGSVKITYKGWDYLGLQGGADFRLSPRLLAGPFVLFSLSQYGEGEISAGAGSGNRNIDAKKLHEWLTLGVRGRFDL